MCGSIQPLLVWVDTTVYVWVWVINGIAAECAFIQGCWPGYSGAGLTLVIYTRGEGRADTMLICTRLEGRQPLYPSGTQHQQKGQESTSLEKHKSQQGYPSHCYFGSTRNAQNLEWWRCEDLLEIVISDIGSEDSMASPTVSILPL